ncbi:MAG: BNR-4 repeat-containing protein [Sedimentisphaeraceae bacterium JB056]
MLNITKMFLILSVLSVSFAAAYTETVLPFDSGVINHGFPEICSPEIEYTPIASLQDISMNFSDVTDFSKPSNFESIFLRGQYNGWFDYVELGIGSVQNVIVKEDFENGGDGYSQDCSGWEALYQTDIDNFIVADSPNSDFGRSGKVTTSYLQAKKIFDHSITDSTPEFYARFIVTFGYQNMRFGFFGETRPGFYLNINPDSVVSGGEIKLKAANYGTEYTSTHNYTISDYKCYEFVVEFTNISNGGKGWVKVRNITDGESQYTALTGLQDVSLNFLNTATYVKPSTFDALYVRGQYNGYFDYIELCEGTMPEKVVSADFEEGTADDSLSTGGWYAINSTDIDNLIYDDAYMTEYGKSAKVISGYLQAKKDFTNTITDSDDEIYAKFVVTPNNQNMKFGFFSEVRPGFYVDIMPGGDIKLQNANHGTLTTSNGEYAILRLHTYEFIVKITDISTGGKGSVFVRDITPGVDIDTPITYQPYFKAERALLDYYPRFQPAYVSFNEDGKAYMQYGSAIIQDVDDGQWQYDDLNDTIESYMLNTLNFKTYEMRNTGSANDPVIRFDADGDAYMLSHFLATRQNDTNTYVGLLLHSNDNMQSWSAYQLPYPFARFEKRDGHNEDCLNRPPVILLSSGYSPCTNYITIPETQVDGSLVIPTPVQIDTDCIGFMYHSGDGNAAITANGKVYIVYARMVTLPGYTQDDGVPSFAVEYDIATKQLGSPVHIGFGGINSQDNHNFPAITVDSSGIFHVVIGAHHNPFKYLYSTQAYNISNWSTPASISEGTTYCSINCDSNDTIYVITRCSNPGYYFRLTMHRKKAGQSWESDEHLLIPYKAYYKVWRHRVAYDPAMDRLFLTYYSQSPQICVFKDEYMSYINTWLNTEKEFDVENGSIPVGTAASTTKQYEFYNPQPSEMSIILTDDGGDSWRMALTPDFDN